MMYYYNALFALLASSLQRGDVPVKAECPSHGCVLTPIDILYCDESAKDALSILREARVKVGIDDENGNANGSDEENRSSLREEALSALRSAGDNSKTTMTLRGYKGGRVADQINQDRAMIVSPFNIILDSSKPKPVAQLLGVFDGHAKGGELTSQYAVDHVPSLLAAKLALIIDQEDSDSYSDSQVVEALKETFDEVDKKDPSLGSAGCTATVVLRLGQKLFIANAGDRCV